MRLVAIEHVSQNLYTEWLDLLKASPTASPFSFPSLFTDCHQVATVRESGELIALAPLCIEVRRGIKHLHFGNMDYADIVLKSPNDILSVTEIFEFLDKHRKEFCDLIDIRGLTLTSNIQLKPGTLNFGSVGAKAFIHQRYPQIINLSTFNDYLNRLSPAASKQLLYKERKLERRVEGFRIEQVHGNNIPELIEHLLIVNQIRWVSRGHSGITQENLYKTWAAQLFAHNRLYLEVAYTHDRPIAAMLCFITKNSLQYLAGGFDIEFSSLSPGKVMMLRAIRKCCELNLSTFDYLKGLETYKMKWGCTLVPTFRLLLGSPAFKGKMAATVLEFESKRKDKRALEKFNQMDKS
jgi:CelD/BcsL family acetyltransferase involved in cellulose biosynthesis